MTALDTTRHVASGNVTGFATRLFAAIAAWNDARVTRNALSRLSDRELDDIGLCRGDIEAISARS